MRKLCLALLILFFCSFSQAGILIEPIVSYNVTAVEYENSSGLKNGTAAQGSLLGGRLGITFLGIFFLAGEYMSGDADWEPENSLNVEVSGELIRKGVTAGMDIPIAPLRVWVGYYESEFTASAPGNDFVFEDGTGVKAGLGLTFLPFIDLNMEYYKGEYDDYTYNGSLQNRKVDDTGLAVSVSIPFSL